MAQAPINVGSSIDQQKLSLIETMINRGGVSLPTSGPQGFTKEENQAYSGAQSALKDSGKGISEEQANYNAGVAMLKSAITAGANAKSAEFAATQQHEQQYADVAKRSLDAFDADIMNPNSKVSKAAEMLNKNDQEVIDNQNKIVKWSNTDNVLTAMLSPFVVPELQRKHNTLAEQGNALQNVVNNSVAEATAQNQINAQAIPKITTDMLKAQQDGVTAAALESQAKADMIASQENTDFIAKRAQNAVQQFQVANSKGDMTRSEYWKSFSTKVDAARAAASNEERRFQLGMAALDIKDKIRGDQFTLERVRDGMVVSMVDPKVIAQLRTTDDLKKMPKAVLDAMFERGFSGQLGNSPFSALNGAMTYSGNASTDRAKKTLQLLAETRNAAAKSLQNDPTYKMTTDKAEKAKLESQNFSSVLANRFANASGSDTLNIPHPSVVLSTPAITAVNDSGKVVAVPLKPISPVTRQVIGPLANTAGVTDSQIVQTMTSGLSSRGASTPFIRQEIQNYISNAVAIRNQGLDMSRFALDKDPEVSKASRSYSVKAPSGGIFGGNTRYDLTRSDQIDRMILVQRQIASENAARQAGINYRYGGATQIKGK